MDLFFQCKACDTEVAAPLDELGRPSSKVACPKCGAALDPALAQRLAAAVVETAAALAAVRERFRVEVLLESDALPDPHGFDEDYTLPEEREHGASG